jgi:DnaJ-class molecular chaperone
MKDYYKILGILRNASIDEIKTSYRKLAKKWHPDKCSEEDKLNAEEMFKEISEAYVVLSDNKKKCEYDGSKLNQFNFDDTFFNNQSNVNDLLNSVFSNDSFNIHQQFFSNGQTHVFNFTNTIPEWSKYNITESLYKEIISNYGRPNKIENTVVKIILKFSNFYYGMKIPLLFNRFFFTGLEKKVETKKLLLTLKFPENLEKNFIEINLNKMGHQYHPLDNFSDLKILLIIEDFSNFKIKNYNLILNNYPISIYQTLFPKDEVFSLKNLYNIDEKFKIDENIIYQDKYYNIPNKGIPNNLFFEQIDNIVDIKENDFININKIINTEHQINIGNEIDILCEKHKNIIISERSNIIISFKYYINKEVKLENEMDKQVLKKYLD